MIYLPLFAVALVSFLKNFSNDRLTISFLPLLAFAWDAWSVARVTFMGSLALNMVI